MASYRRYAGTRHISGKLADSQILGCCWKCQWCRREDAEPDEDVVSKWFQYHGGQSYFKPGWSEYRSGCGLAVLLCGHWSRNYRQLDVWRDFAVFKHLGERELRHLRRYKSSRR